METVLRKVMGGLYKLVIDVPGTAIEDKPVLAQIKLHEGSGCWTIEDVRLSRYRLPTPYFSMGAEHYHAAYEAKTPVQARRARALLGEHRETPTAHGGSSFAWCTYEGIVPGRTPDEVAGQPLQVSSYDPPIYFTQKEALAYLKAAEQFWDDCPHDAADPDIIQRAGAVKLDNLKRQSSGSEFWRHINQLARLEVERADTVAALNATPALGCIRIDAPSVFACTSNTHLRGFTPLARYAQMLTPSEGPLVATIHALRHSPTPLPRVAEWLLMARNGQLYVDCVKGDEKRAFCGLDPQAPLLGEVLLPSGVYDFFKAMAGPAWPGIAGEHPLQTVRLPEANEEYPGSVMASAVIAGSILPAAFSEREAFERAVAVICGTAYDEEKGRTIACLDDAQAEQALLSAQLCEAVLVQPNAAAIGALLDQGAPIDGIHSDGLPLRTAAAENRAVNVRSLLSRGANPNAIFTAHGDDPDCPWPTALHLAVARNRKLSALVLLAGGADPQFALPGGQTALQLAEKAGDKRMLKAFAMPLHVAASLGMTEECVALVHRGMDPNAKSLQDVDGIKNKSACEIAEKIGYPHTSAAMRSVLARREAGNVLASLNNPNNMTAAHHGP